MEGKTVRLSAEVMTELQKYAEGFQNPDSVLRLILGIQPRSFSGNKPEGMELWELKTDPDLNEIAVELASEIEESLNGEEDRVNEITDRLFPTDPDNYPEWERLTLLAGKAVLQLVSEHLMSAYKMPGGGEEWEKERWARKSSEPSALAAWMRTLRVSSMP